MAETPDFRPEERPVLSGRPHSVDLDDTDSLIDRAATVTGTIQAKRGLRIDGTVDGEIISEGLVTVSQRALIKGKIQARDLIIHGTVEGEVQCSHRLELAQSGALRGKATTVKVAVEEGATFDGELHTTNAEQPNYASAGEGTAAVDAHSASTAPQPVRPTIGNGPDAVWTKTDLPSSDR